jgi:thiol-disulfide isomerase/thioredoxin
MRKQFILSWFQFQQRARLVSFGFFVLFLLSACAAGAGRQAPLDSLPSVTVFESPQTELNLLDLKGQPLLIHFWATWCVPCITELPRLNTFAAQMRGSIRVLAIAVGDSWDEIRTTAPSRLQYLHILADPDSETLAAFGLQHVPYTLFINEQGHRAAFPDPATGALTKELTGARNWDGPLVSEYFRQALKTRH